MTNTRTPLVVPAIPPKPPTLNLLNSSLRPDLNTDPSGAALFDITPEQLAQLPDDLREELEDLRGDGWTRGFWYAPENHWEAEIRDPCDSTSIDQPALPAPQKPTGEAKAGGGTVPAEALEYSVTALNANGETTASPILKITPGAEGSVLLTWPKVSDAATYIVRRAKGATKKPLRIKTKAGGKSVNPVPAPIEESTQTIEFLDIGEAEEAGKKPPSPTRPAALRNTATCRSSRCWPFLLRAADSCSTFGFERRDFKGRAERLLENAQYKAIEKECWSGALAKAKGFPNQWLDEESRSGLGSRKPHPRTADAPSISRGLQILQDALAECGFGGQGMIHLQRQTATNLLTVIESDPHFTANNGVMYDLFGNIIVPGVGYNGAVGFEETAAGAGKAWMCATDLVSCRVEPTPTAVARTFSEMTDWGQGGEPNTVRFWAQKLAAVSLDAACGPFWVEVKLAE